MPHNPKLKEQTYLKDNAVYVKQDAKIHIPVNYEERGLLVLEDEAACLGVFNVIIGDDYFVVISPLIYTLPFHTFKQIEVEGEAYYELEFKANTPIIQSLEVAKNALLAIEILVYIILRAKIPYFLSPQMCLRLLSGTTQAAGIALDENANLAEMLISLSHRSAKDNQVLARHQPDAPVIFVALTDVNFGTFTNFSRFLNSYQSSGLITSLTNTTLTNPGKLETVLRR